MNIYLKSVNPSNVLILDIHTLILGTFVVLGGHYIKKKKKKKLCFLVEQSRRPLIVIHEIITHFCQIIKKEKEKPNNIFQS